MGAFTLSYSPYGISVRDINRDERMVLVSIPLLGDKLVPPSAPRVVAASINPSSEETPPRSPKDAMSATEEPPSGSGLTPPSSPIPFKRQPIILQRHSSLLQATAPNSRGPFSTAVAETLIIGPNGIEALSPIPLVLRLEKLCSDGRWEEALALVDEERRKGRRGEIEGDKVSCLPVFCPTKLTGDRRLPTRPPCVSFTYISLATCSSKLSSRKLETTFCAAS